VFTSAYAQETNTNPSHASMLTGLYPHVHGNQANGHRLAADRETLAQILSQAGFRSAAFVSGFTMRNSVTGFSRGFELYDDELTRRDRRPATETVERALAWLAGIPTQERFFLLVHLFDAHGPYRPEGAYVGMFRSPSPGRRVRHMPKHQKRFDEHGQLIRRVGVYIDDYDAMIRTVDDQLVRLLGGLDLEETMVVVVADHGETLGGRPHWGLAHGCRTVDEQIRVPFILYVPGGKARRIDQLAETVDILPTVLEALGVPPPLGLRLDGHSLMPLITGDGKVHERQVVFSSARATSGVYADRGYRLDEARRIHSVRSRRWKLVLLPGLDGEIEELYDMRSDPGETSNVIAAHPAVRRDLRRVLDAWLARGGADSPPPQLSADEAEALRSLGYLE
jgi:arylsulfatase A-like enzyme